MSNNYFEAHYTPPSMAILNFRSRKLGKDEYRNLKKSLFLIIKNTNQFNPKEYFHLSYNTHSNKISRKYIPKFSNEEYAESMEEINYFLFGSFDRVREQFIITLRLINAKSKAVEKTLVRSYAYHTHGLAEHLNDAVNQLLKANKH